MSIGVDVFHSPDRIPVGRVVKSYPPIVPYSRQHSPVRAERDDVATDVTEMLSRRGSEQADGPAASSGNVSAVRAERDVSRWACESSRQLMVFEIPETDPLREVSGGGRE